MICPSCNSGFLCEAINSKPLVLSYRGHIREVATLGSKECSNCLYELTGTVEGIDVDSVMVDFKREVNGHLSTAEIS